MRVLYLSFIIIIGLLVFISCNKANIFQTNSTSKIVNDLGELRTELVQAPYGWKVIYFPRTDSLIFSDVNKVYTNKDLDDNQKSSYGGFYFLMRFFENGTVQMQADFDDKSRDIQSSEFEVKLSTFTQVSFTSYNYIHKLSNNEFNGSADFLYIGKDFFGNLIFKTASYIEPAREYIIFEKLQNPTDTNFISRAYANRKFFDSMKNPQLCIHKGSRIFYKSDVFQKSKSELNASSLENQQRTRYYIFTSTKVADPMPGNESAPLQSLKLGSGYVGTERGILFYSGIRYDKKTIFYDFQKQEANKSSGTVDGCGGSSTSARFVCELVQVYDSINRMTLLVPKHIAPKGTPTYFIAEIYEDKRHK